MRKYIVKVNGSVYEVEVEELTAGESAIAAENAPKAAAPAEPPKPEKTEQPKEQAPAQPVQSAPQGAKTITAPMPGSIISVAVKAGDSFRSGQVLLVLEAMKMENEIMAP
ncbi:MAG: acetyl-CoA carboxylase biotin carboxyl carrier protein subunit, partial [Clostridia bacterium]|nr:acetyl-CoA carboxylase biotin carboxyl carrier protein subunit [Clostridia bacterium]